MKRTFVMLYFSSLSLALDQNFDVIHIHKQRQFVEKQTIHAMIGVNVVVMPSKMEFSSQWRITTSIMNLSEIINQYAITSASGKF